jgi:simple sugar transport system ATP-binding protein
MPLALRTEGLVKTFDSLVANDHIDFDVERGELHALLGENGAGKTTLLNVLYGVLKADEGDIFIDEQPARITSTHDAIVKYKIGKVSQHSDLVPTFTVAENILLRAIPKRMWFFKDKRAMKKRVAELLATTGYRLDPEALVEDLSVGEQQHVELLKVLYQDAEIIFLDEPSSLLAPQEVNELFTLLGSLVARGRSIIFVTHKLDEALKCDRITVLRNGKISLKAKTKDVTFEDLLKAMFGGKVHVSGSPRSTSDQPSEPVLEVRNLCTGTGLRRSDLKDISFAVHRGEILGIAGIAGNGQKQLLSVVTGFRAPERGQIVLNGEDVTDQSSPHFYRKKNMLAYVPEERRETASFVSLSIAENLILGEARKSQFFPGHFRDGSAIQAFSENLVREYDVRTTGISAVADSLSGGNLQKMILARELSIDTDLIIVAQPSYGLDFKTMEFVHSKLIDKKVRGKAVLLVSKDLDEIMKLSDRIAVIYEGQLKTIPREEASIETIGRMMVGMDKEA